MRPGHLLLILTLPLLAHAAVHAQGEPPLTLLVQETTWSYGPETWKTNPAGPDGTEDLSFWYNSLGTQVEWIVRVERQGLPATPDWTYDATLTDGATTLTGRVDTGTEPGTLRLRFDVDGQRATPQTPLVDALQPGPWTMRLDARSATGPEGYGQIRIDSHAVTFEADRAGIAVPESIIPRIDDIGAGTATWMPLQPIHGQHSTLLRTNNPASVQWSAWYPTRVASIENLTITSPAGWTELQLATVAPVGNLVPLSLDADQLPPGLWILCALQPGAPAVTWLLPIGTAATVTNIQAPNPDPQGQSNPLGPLGPVTYQLASDSPDALDLMAGTAYALRQITLGTTGTHHEDGSQPIDGSVLAQTALHPTNRGTAQAALDTTLLRASHESSYAFLAILLDETGTYQGHSGHLRGTIPTLEPGRLRAGQESPITLRLQHAGALADDHAGPIPPGLALLAHIDLQADNKMLSSDTVSIPHGGTLAHTARYQPTQTGSTTLEAHIDTGDLQFSLQRTASVAAANDAKAPGIGTPLLATGLMATAFVLRKRDIRG